MKMILWIIGVGCLLGALCLAGGGDKYTKPVIGTVPPDWDGNCAPGPILVFTRQNWMAMLEAHPQLPRELKNVKRERKDVVSVHPYDYLLVKRKGVRLPDNVPHNTFYARSR